MPDEPIVDPVVEPEAVADPEPAVVEPPVETWGGVSQDDWQQTQEYLQQIGQALPALYQMVQGQQAPAATPEVPDAPEYDPFDPESVDNYLEWKLSQGMEQAFKQHLGPFEGLLGSIANEKGEALARQELASHAQRVGKFDEDLAYVVGAGMIERGADPSQALGQAAHFAKSYEDRVRADEREVYKRELAGLAGAPAEVTGGASSTEIEKVPTGRGRYEKAIENAMARRRPVNPIG